MKKVHKRAEKESPNGCIFDEITGFPRKWKSEFRLCRRERVEVHAFHFLSLCPHFCPSFFLQFFHGFGPPPWSLKNMGRRQRRDPLK